MKLTRAEFEALFRAASTADDIWRKQGGQASQIAALARAMRKVHAEGVPRSRRQEQS